MFTNLSTRYCHFIDEADDWQQTPFAPIADFRGSMTNVSKELQQWQAMMASSFVNIFNKMDDVECSAFLSGKIFCTQSAY